MADCTRLYNEWIEAGFNHEHEWSGRFIRISCHPENQKILRVSLAELRMHQVADKVRLHQAAPGPLDPEEGGGP